VLPQRFQREYRRDSPLLDLEDGYSNNQGTGSFGGALWAISHRSF
jgi:hypothetical protein